MVPNFFTPDGDGINDGWMPLNLKLDQYPNTDIHVYNCYGKLLTKLRPKENWAGIYNQTNMTSGDYWYIIIFNKVDGPKNLVGHFNLYR
ncbi:MAG: T9SS type B sorting domain-containing protein [Flavobacteriaceae bacterium]